ncbi:MAG TPA: 3-hydroxyacyl-CoA dehydrogenase NAD-binding domain-containing protein [Nevskiaceae bacterium]|nr:3-hydroxyacyl-CoA dehydrogenase NAD-binding domain-containing protein [Nevskiaceae bacterium]
MTDTVIRLDVREDRIAVLTIDYPGRSMNVIDAAFMRDLSACIERVAGDDNLIGAIVTSGKSSFVAGADLDAMETNLNSMSDDPPEVLFEKCASLSRLLRRMETCGKPFVAAINGVAMGGGFELCLACHWRVASDAKSVLLGLPEVQVGLLPGSGGTQRLPRLIGITTASQWLLQGRHVPAEEALKAGAIDKIVPAVELIDTAASWLKDQPTPVQPWDRKQFRIPGGGAMDPRVAPAFVVGNAMLQASTFHNYPAPLAIQSCLFEGSRLPIDAALRIESKYLAKLSLGAVSRAMTRTLFVSKMKAERGLRRPKGIEKHRFDAIGIVGAGMMGSAIALCAARKGIKAYLIDRDLATATSGKGYAVKRLNKRVQRGRMTQEKMDATLAHIVPTASYGDLADVELVIEAVFEDRQVKGEVVKKVEAAVGSSCIIATNTSALPITLLATASKRPQQFVGMHFFSPADKMPLVEVICGKQTTPRTLAYALDLVGQLGKLPIVVNDGRGFFTSRFIGAFVDDAIGMVSEGVAPALIENCSRQAGMPVAPLALTDELSIDLSVHAGEAQAREFPDEYKPGRSVPVLKELLDLGRLGKKVGKGFYDYGDDGKRLWPQLAAHYPLRDEQPDPADLRRRVLYVQAVEAARAFEEGVLMGPEDGDLGAIFGVGYPSYTGGPFSFIDGVGVGRFVAEADRLANLFGEQLRPPQLLRDMAAKGQRFYPPAKH